MFSWLFKFSFSLFSMLLFFIRALCFLFSDFGDFKSLSTFLIWELEKADLVVIFL